MRNHVRSRGQIGLEGREHRLLGGIAGGHQVPDRRVKARDDPHAKLGKDQGHRQAEEHRECVLHQRYAIMSRQPSAPRWDVTGKGFISNP